MRLKCLPQCWEVSEQPLVVWLSMCGSARSSTREVYGGGVEVVKGACLMAEAIVHHEAVVLCALHEAVALRLKRASPCPPMRGVGHGSGVDG